MSLSFYSQKLLNWFTLYKITPTAYNAHLSEHPKVQKKGVFVDALQELVDYEANYGYFTF